MNDTELTRIFDKSIKTLNFSVKTYNILNRANILTVGDIVKKDREKGGLRRVRDLGVSSLKEIKSVLKELGVNL